MPSFVCDKCHHFDNTGTGWFHSAYRNEQALGPEYPNGEVYCFECTPTHYLNGESTGKGGRWHNRFPKRLATKEEVLRLIHVGSIKPPMNKGVIEVVGSLKEVEEAYLNRK